MNKHLAAHRVLPCIGARPLRFKLLKSVPFSLILFASFPLLAEPLEFVTFQASSQYYPSVSITEQALLLNKGAGNLNINVAPSASSMSVNENLSGTNIISTSTVKLGNKDSTKNKGLLTATASTSASSLESGTAKVNNLYIYNKEFPATTEQMSWLPLTLSVKPGTGESGTNQIRGKFLKIGTSATVFGCTLTAKETPAYSSCKWTLTSMNILGTEIFSNSWVCQDNVAHVDFDSSGSTIEERLSTIVNLKFNYNSETSGWKEYAMGLANGSPSVFYDVYLKSDNSFGFSFASQASTSIATYLHGGSGYDSRSTAFQKAKTFIAGKANQCKLPAQAFNCEETVAPATIITDPCTERKVAQAIDANAQVMCATMEAQGQDTCYIYEIREDNYNPFVSVPGSATGKLLVYESKMQCDRAKRTHFYEITCK